MAFEYNSGGTAVTDKKVYCTTAVTLNGTRMYIGRVSGLAAETVVGTASTTYGCWSTINKGGTRYNIISAGVPGTSADVLWDIQSGRIYSLVSKTYYVRYWKYADLMNEGRIYQIEIPYTLTGTIDDVYVNPCPWDVKWGEYAIMINGNRPSGTLNLKLKGATGAGGASANMQMTAAETRTTSGFKQLATALSMDTQDDIVVRGAGSGFDLISITLREKLE